MISLRKGTLFYKFIMLLAQVGEFPANSLCVLGNEKEYKELINKLIQPQTIRNPETGECVSITKIVNISGKGKLKKFRLSKGVLPILNWLNSEGYFLNKYLSHKWRGDKVHIERNHRVAEAMGMFMGAGYEFREYKLPTLQKNKIHQINFTCPSFYTGVYIKQLCTTEMNKTMFTRIVGAVFAGNDCCAVYNTRNAVMKWCGSGECKAKIDIEKIVRMNTPNDKVDSAILFGASSKVALGTLEETEKNRRLELRFDGIYKYIYFVPLNEAGTRQLNLFSLPNWKDRILDILFESEHRSFNRGLFEYDAFLEGEYVLSFLDGDIARLRRFKDAIEKNREKCSVICFEDQESLIKEYLGELVQTRVVTRLSIETELNLKRRDIIEED